LGLLQGLPVIGHLGHGRSVYTRNLGSKLPVTAKSSLVS
jgi:hypothetical protein